MSSDIVLLIVGFVLLIAAGDALVRGAVALSLRLGMPAVIVSATVVAFGTSAPELLISVNAALEGAAGIALGNVVGSNIANVLLVLGVPAMIAPIAGCGSDAHRNLYFMIGATAVFSGFVMMGTLPQWGGVVLIAITLVMVADSVYSGMRADSPEHAAAIEAELVELEDVDPFMAPWKVGLLIGAGLIGLPFGAQMLVDGAQGIATRLGVSEALIGLTVIAIGTSLPELATTVMAALRQQADVVIGNVVGSNIFNITAIIGAAALVTPLEIPTEILERDIWVMLAATLVLVPYVLLCRRIGRISGLIFLGTYILFIYLAYAATLGG